MKKIICILGIMVISLLLCGCAEQQTAPDAGGSEDVAPAPGEPDINTTVGDLTQEDLDHLKEELEELEYENLGGLSEK